MKEDKNIESNEPQPLPKQDAEAQYFSILLAIVAIILSLFALSNERLGPRGPRGYDGPKGETTIRHIYEKVGPQGPQGPRGPEGGTIIKHEYEKIGPQGPTGIQGPRGLQGIEGPAGPPGVQGSVGPKGERGKTGPQGPAGPVGAKGEDGTLPILKLCFAVGLTFLFVKVVWEICYRYILNRRIKVGENLFLRWKKK